MKLVKVNWYGFDHELVNKQFGGDLGFVNSFCVKGEYKPVAVYRAANPDRAKGHKDYMLLQTTEGGGGLVRGMTPEEMEEFRIQEGVHCLKCDEVIYSVNRHDYRHCSCKNAMVDGGRDYIRRSTEDVEVVQIDLLTDLITYQPHVVVLSEPGVPDVKFDQLTTAVMKDDYFKEEPDSQ